MSLLHKRKQGFTYEMSVMRMLDQIDREPLRAFLDELQPYDKAKLFLTLPIKYHTSYLSFLSRQELAEILEELDLNDQSKLIDRIGPEKAVKVLNLMSNDDAADLLAQLEDENAEELLTAMESGEAEKIKELMTYHPDTAGGIMTSEYVWIYSHYTASETIEKIREIAPTAEIIYYIYVINKKNKKLVGVVSIRDLLLAGPDTPLEDIMYERIITVPADMDQEEVAKIMERYDFLALPVVNQRQELLGIVTVDDIIDVLIEEAREDVDKFSALGGQTKAVLDNPFQSSIRRLPWLVMLLFIGMLSATIMGQFEGTISDYVALAYFMPLIAGMTGNTGTQSLALVIRGLSQGEINRKVITTLIRREFIVGLIIGTVCSIFIAGLALVWKGDPVLALIVGSSLWCTLIIGTMAGTVIPLILNYFKVDPAIASGPLITTINDIFSLTIYFSIATLFIHKLL